MTFGKLKDMGFTSKKVSLKVNCNVYSAMVLSVLRHGAAESWALSSLVHTLALHTPYYGTLFYRHYPTTDY